ncbi:TIGR02099 family protein [Allopseudospirillum japonicum]|uniref:TIGR02099 family protein n=1 Tax=Allopseudospirillum japonicum TaxID=64971 RepID=A0A1H6R162_9GAMM|nr:AsmA-like C-terminal region-containing protein [Allopseudospirillum japonicum]SEI48126.1 TIGR02099 family protein [Allopseudospirillum japonicum]
MLVRIVLYLSLAFVGLQLSVQASLRLAQAYPHLWQPQLTTWVQTHTDWQINLQGWQLSFVGLNPRVQISSFQIAWQRQPLLAAQQLDIQLDWWASWWYGQAVFSYGQVQGLQVYQAGLKRYFTTTTSPSKSQVDPPWSKQLNAWLQEATLYPWVQLQQVQLINTQGEASPHLQVHWSYQQQVTSPLTSRPLKQYQLVIQDTQGMRFHAQMRGRPQTPSFQLLAYAQQETSLTPWATWLAADFPEIAQLEVHSQIQAWLQWKGLGLPRWQVQVQKMRARWAALEITQVEPMYLQGHVVADQQTRWQINSGPWQVQQDQQAYTLPDFAFQFNHTHSSWHLTQEGAWDLQVFSQFTQLALWPPDVRSWIQGLNPRGRITQLQAVQQAGQAWQIQARLQDIQIEAWQGVPQVQGGQAEVHMNAQGGHVRLLEAPLTLGFAELFKQSWHFTRASGVLGWQLEAQQARFYGRDLVLEGPQGEAIQGEFHLHIPPAPQADRLYLNLSLQQLPITHGLAYLPQHALAPELYQRLARLLASAQGQLTQGHLVYNGLLAAQATQSERTLSLSLDLAQASFAFDPAWPRLTQADAQVHLHNQQVQVMIPSAQLAGLTVTDLTLDNLHPQQQGPHSIQDGLNLNAHLQGDAAQVQTLLNQSPLQPYLPHGFAQWQLQGGIQSKIKAYLPFNAELAPQVQVNAQIRQASFAWPQHGLEITQIRGPIHFDSQQGISSLGLQGQFAGGPLQVQMGLDPSQQWYLSAQGRAQISQLKLAIALPWQAHMQGEFAYQARLSQLSQGLRLAFNTDLQGVRLDLPPPLGKDAAQARPLAFDLVLDQVPSLQLEYGEHLQVVANLSQKTPAIYARLSPHSRTSLAIPTTPGITLEIRWPELDLATWVQHLQNTSSQNTADLPPIKLDLHTQTAHLGAYTWQNMYVQATSGPLSSWQLQWQAQQAQGEAKVHLQGHQPWQIHFEYLDLTPTSTPLSTPQTQDPWQDFKISPGPVIDVSIQHLRWQHLDIKNGYARIQPQTDSLVLDPWRFDLAQSQWQGRLQWHMQEGTQIQGRLQGQDAGALLALWTQEAPLHSESHALEMTLAWPASPLGFALPTAEGRFQFELTQGNFPRANNAAVGASRLFSLFSLDALLRRMRLDFADLSKQGISFDQMSGDYQLRHGTLTSQTPLKVESAATRFQLQGSTDLLAQTLDQQLSLVLPIGQSLPLAAILVGAPQVGGAIWVAQKLFGHLLEEVTQAHYRIQGDWLNPQVELIKVFD